MKEVAARIVSTRRLPQLEWLEAHCRGRCPTGDVILHAPSFAFQAPGGGENQLVQTGRHLEELGVPVRLFSAWTDRLEEARLLHLFGMSREGLELARVAKGAGIPVVLSPICWYEPRAIAALEPGAIRKIASLAAWGAQVRRTGDPELAARAAWAGRPVLPNSRSEADQLIRLFGVDRARDPRRAQRSAARDRLGDAGAVLRAWSTIRRRLESTAISRSGGNSCFRSGGSSRGRTRWA